MPIFRTKEKADTSVSAFSWKEKNKEYLDWLLGDLHISFCQFHNINHFCQTLHKNMNKL